ncbi:MAG: DNRLRE domain-containing protein [Nitrospira sp.]
MKTFVRWDYSRTMAFCICLAIGTLWSPPLATAITVTLGAGKLSTIFENQPENSIGRGPGVFIGADSSGSPRRGLIDFNIAANLPFGATITSASLTMYLGLVGEAAGTPDQMPRTIELHRITSDWAHGPTGLGVTTISGTDQGFPAVPPSPTWNDRRYQQDQPWTTPGGDFLSTASASTSVGQAVNQAYTWQSNPQLVADVQLMLDQPSLGFGWILRNVDERVPGSERALYTKDWSDPLLRPQLLISYDPAPVPLPAAAWLFGSGTLLLAGARRLARSRMARVCVAVIFSAFAAVMPAVAETVSLLPNHDATIFGESINQGVPNTDGQNLFNRSNGAGPGLFSGGNQP